MTPATDIFTSLYNHTKRFTCGEHLLRCGIDTSTYIVLIIIIYYSTNSLSRLRNRAILAGPLASQASGNPLHDYTSFPCSISTSRLLSYPERAGIPNDEEVANTPSRTRPETPASPTRASTTVTGTLHTHFSVDPTISQILPDSANLPPGLYCSACEVCRTDPLLSEITNTDHSHVLIHDL